MSAERDEIARLKAEVRQLQQSLASARQAAAAAPKVRERVVEKRVQVPGPVRERVVEKRVQVPTPEEARLRAENRRLKRRLAHGADE